MRAHLTDTFSASVGSKQRAKSTPPKSNRFVTDVDAAFVQKILDIPERNRKSNVRHHCQADDISARREVAKG
jgi:hypothetical protein